ncbi:tyrosine-type recombinase/integrase [Pararhizobium sp. BT-229]|uniref:tyrosine-type recombinase/integrase n=1 Tax=Pararhizobium sp. BT-229 TaxID=2986923 RepID=UPI0021F71992|nr:site-specific integrase [Pararhizobium sp. BT-229]MCV9960409.1 tyrosine-type recombinase/integrase [Pararhizobium sp. BT-229]
MGRTKDKLTAKGIESLTEIGRHSDGGGLYLKVTDTGRRWVFMYAWHGRRVELGLGSSEDVSLRAARDVAQRYRSMLAQTPKVDPRIERAKAKEKPITFGTFALEFINGKQDGWRNDKHKDQWIYSLSLRKNAAGKWLDDGFCTAIRDVPVPEIAVDDIVRVLRPIWLTKGETARRVRGRIESVLDAAKAKGVREGENPAAWKGNLKTLLPDKKKQEVRHHAAMPFSDVPAFTAKLIHAQSPSNAALAFTILTAARSGETMGAQWDEIDMSEAVWRVPAGRMKGGREHVVPLSDGAMKLLDVMQALRTPKNDFVFPGQKGGGLSVMALTMSMRRLEAGDFTPHGFRSAFRDWAGDTTSFQRDDIEQCLAHAIANKVEAAYRRGQALEKRRKIMDAWWKFNSGQSDAVIQLTHRLSV